MLQVLNLPWWYYVLGVLGALLLGAFLTAIGFFIWAKYESWKLKKGTPFETPLVQLPFIKKKVINRKEVSEFLKQPEIKEKYNFAGLPEKLDEKEVKDDERKKSDKFRELEKLRAETINTRSSSNEGDSSSAKRKSIQKRIDTSSGQDSNNDSRTVQLD